MKNKIEHEQIYFLINSKMSQFLTNENIKLMWDIIYEETLLKQQPDEIAHNTQKLFYNNLKSFYAHESRTTGSLVELNKAYITLVLTHFKQIARKRIRIDEPATIVLDTVVLKTDDDRIDQILIDLEIIKRDMQKMMEYISKPNNNP